MIVIGYDGSPDARRAVADAGRLLSGRALVLHVWTAAIVPPPVSGAVLPGVPPPVTDAEHHEAERRGRQIAAEGAELAVAAGLDAEGQVASGTGPGDISRRIVEAAVEHDADAIVVGRHGDSRIKSFLFGSVSHEVVLHSPVPVLVTPPPEKRDGDETT